jgi:uncharacterized protein YjbI with pentapeptide repeats
MIDFEGANLRKTNLTWSNLREANLKWADLTKASLIETNLQGANLIKANLIKANLHGVDITGANLKEDNLREVHYLTFDQLSKVKTFHDAKLDKKLLNSLKKEYGSFFKGKCPHYF